MMIETTRDIRLKDIRPTAGVSEQQLELAQGMVRVNHLYRSALKVAVTQMEILDEEFCSLNDHSPIHHIEYRIKSLDSIEKKLKRRGYELTIDNIYAHIQDVAGIRVICNYLDDIYYLRSLLTRSESYHVIRESDYIKEPKPSGYRSLHLIVEVPIVISEGTLHLPVEIQHHRDGHVGQSRARAALQVRARLLGGRCRAPAPVLRGHQRGRPRDAGHLPRQRTGIPRVIQTPGKCSAFRVFAYT